MQVAQFDVQDPLRVALEQQVLTKDRKYIWHPGQNLGLNNFASPLLIQAAKGPYIYLSNGRGIIDAISSWWCKSLGHSNSRLNQVLITQLQQFEHVIFANTTSEVVVNLAEKLITNSKMAKVFFSGDGATAVEIAIKLSIHYRALTKQTLRNKFVILANSYHGETLGALSLTELNIYRTPYQNFLFDPLVIKNVPYSNDCHTPNVGLSYQQQIEDLLAPIAHTITAIIVEPLIQGAAGMQIYNKNFLLELARFAKQHQIHLIADEIMTGVGRCGKFLACEYASISPDLVCIGKGLTAGYLPFSAVMIAKEFEQIFCDASVTAAKFLHSHTYSGNPLAAAVALETLQILAEQNLYDYALQLGNFMYQQMLAIAKETKILTNVRYLGAIVAADLILADAPANFAQKIADNALQLGALLRPINNTIYWLPPLNTEFATIIELAAITKHAIALSLA